MPRPVALLFLLSGAVALGFEVLWAKELARLLGGTTTSTAFVVAVFLGGMGVGYLLGGRVASRIERPLVAYGLAELGLASSSVLVVHVVPSLEGALSVPAAYATSAGLLLVPTVLAGFTLPVLVEATRGTVGDALGSLYALNTAGAVLGVLVTGLVLIGALGLSRTALVLAAVGALVGTVAIGLGRRQPPRPTPCASADAPSTAHGELPREWLLVAALTGLASIAEEVLWSRALAVHFNSSTYALSIILAVFLLGLALGAVGATAFLRRGVSARSLLLASQVGAALLVLVSPELLQLVEELVPGYVGVSQIDDVSSWLGTLGIGALRTGLVLLPPTVLLGFAIPLVAELFAGGDVSRRGQTASLIVAANTVGSVAGSLGARFVLLPAFGIGGGLRVAAILHVVIAVTCVLARGEPLRPALPVSRWLALPALLLVAAIVRPASEPFVGRLPAMQEILLIDEGVQDTTVVAEDLSGARQIYSNGIAYAGDTPIGQRYMRLLGHLPALHARERGRALVICVGTGMTAAAVARHPFERIDVVDISPAIHLTLPLFERSNDAFYTDRRVRFHREDGRVFAAQAARGSYDVVTMEPPPPRAAGVAALYSTELYRRARDLLREGGVFAQWLPLHGMTRGEIDMLTRTFLEVFPDGRVVLLHPIEAALIATRGEGAPDATVSARAAEPGIRDHLDGIGVGDPLALPSASANAVWTVIGEGPVVTDDRPRIEHFGAGLGDDRGVASSDALAGGASFAAALWP